MWSSHLVRGTHYWVESNYMKYNLLITFMWYADYMCTPYCIPFSILCSILSEYSICVLYVVLHSPYYVSLSILHTMFHHNVWIFDFHSLLFILLISLRVAVKSDQFAPCSINSSMSLLTLVSCGCCTTHKRNWSVVEMHSAIK